MSNAKRQSMAHKAEYDILRENIKFYRARKKMTQQQLADAVGVSQAHIGAIEAENVERYVSLELIFCLADALDVEAYRLFKRLE